MPLLAYNVGTRPQATLSFVTITSTGWTPLWGANLNRSFANVIGGTGISGEDILVTANPLALPGDDDVAVFYGLRGAAYFETRGTNTLYARRNSGAPLAVRTSQTVQVPKSPVPVGLLGTKDYKIETICGGGALTYDDDGFWAPVLPTEATRLRATILGSEDAVMVVANFTDPSLLGLVVISSFVSSGTAFPGTLALEGVNEIVLINLGSVGEQAEAFWVNDYMVAL